MIGQLRLRTIAAGAVFVMVAGLWIASGEAHAGGPAGPDGGVSEVLSTGSTCPASDAVWAIVVGMVPRAAAHVLAAKPRVSLFDLEDQYLARIVTDHGTVERTTKDPARDCDQRARFVAEFVVLTLLPPQLGPGDPPPEPLPAPPSAAPPQAQPPTPTRPASPMDGPPRRAGAIRIEMGAAVQDSPGLAGAASLLSPGADVRVRAGAGTFAAIVGAAYFPGSNFQVGGGSGSLVRVPSVAGARARVFGGAFELGADLAFSVALERYTGTSPKYPQDATRFAPGVEAGVIGSVRLSSWLAPFAGLRCAFFPIVQDLATTPQGAFGKTASLWFASTLGLSFEP